MRLSAIDRKILNCIQDDIPLKVRPFKVLSSRLGVKENILLGRIKSLKSKGIIRRFSASISHSKLKFKSTLIALRVPQEKVEPIAADIASYPEVTHCYLREGDYNLWAVFIYKNGNLTRLLKRLNREIGKKNILNLKTKKQFKLNTRIRV